MGTCCGMEFFSACVLTGKRCFDMARQQNSCGFAWDGRLRFMHEGVDGWFKKWHWLRRDESQGVVARVHHRPVLLGEYDGSHFFFLLFSCCLSVC